LVINCHSTQLEPAEQVFWWVFVDLYIGRVFPFFATPKLGRELNKELEKFAFAITFTQRKKGKDLPVWKTYENACFVGFSG